MSKKLSVDIRKILSKRALSISELSEEVRYSRQYIHLWLKNNKRDTGAFACNGKWYTVYTKDSELHVLATLCIQALKPYPSPPNEKQIDNLVKACLNVIERYRPAWLEDYTPPVGKSDQAPDVGPAIKSVEVIDSELIFIGMDNKRYHIYNGSTGTVYMSPWDGNKPSYFKEVYEVYS